MQTILNGVVSGLEIAVLAVAFALVYRPTGILFFALGGIYVFASYTVAALRNIHLPWSIAIALAVVCGSVIALLCELLNHWPLDRRKATYAPHLVSSLGIYLILEQAVVLWKGADVLVLVPGSHGTVSLGDVFITRGQIYLTIACAALLVLFFAWLGSSKIGLRLRGLAESPTQMALLGHNVRSLRMVGFACAGFIAAAVGITATYDQSIDPYSGLPEVLLALVAVIAGGKRSFIAPVLAGVSLGVLREGIVWFLSEKWQEAITYSLLACVLMFANGIGYKRWHASN